MSYKESLKGVVAHYKEHSDYQLMRLEQDSPIEYAITLRKLDRWVSPGSKIADVGTGAGHYAIHLAQRNCYLYLIDIAENLLEISQQKFKEAKLESYILGTHAASATHLEFIPDSSVDVALLLGPFYHLSSETQRQTALKEAYRILKKGGIIFASGINRLAVFRELWQVNRFNSIKEKTPTVKSTKSELYKFIHTGVSNETVFPPLRDAFFATSRQFKEEFLGYFDELEFLGLESFSAHAQKEFFNKEEELKSHWLDLIEITGKTQEGISASEHFLFIGQKISN